MINLSDAEKEICNGSRWKLARFVDDFLVEIFDQMEIEFLEDAQAMVNKALEKATV